LLIGKKRLTASAKLRITGTLGLEYDTREVFENTHAGLSFEVTFAVVDHIMTWTGTEYTAQAIDHLDRLHLNEREEPHNLWEVKRSGRKLTLGVKIRDKCLNTGTSRVHSVHAGFLSLIEGRANIIALDILKESLIETRRASGEIMNERSLNFEGLRETRQREYAAYALLTTLPMTAVRGIELEDVANFLIIDFFVATLVSHHLLAKLKKLDGIWELYRLRALHGLSPLRYRYADPDNQRTRIRKTIELVGIL
jgi:hypothetical protein